MQLLVQQRTHKRARSENLVSGEPQDYESFRLIMDVQSCLDYLESLAIKDKSSVAARQDVACMISIVRSSADELCVMRPPPGSKNGSQIVNLPTHHQRCAH